jgi:hypothetical protein
MPEKLKLLSWRDIVFIAVPSLLLAAGGILAGGAVHQASAARTRLIISTGGEAGAYQRFAARYQATYLARYGIEAGGPAFRGVDREPCNACATQVSKSMPPSFRVAPGASRGMTRNWFHVGRFLP